MRLLVVDDQAMNRKLLRTLLLAEGNTVLEAGDGAEALRVLEREKVDAVLSDILMPGMDGFRLACEMRKRPGTAGLPLVLVTGTFVSKEDRELARDMGADAYLEKPIQTGALLATVQGLVDHPRAPTPPPTAEVLERYSAALHAKLGRRSTVLEESRLALGAKNTELARALRELDQAKHQMQRLLDSAGEGVYGLDTQGLATFVNPAGARILGYEPEELLGKSIHDLVHHHTRDGTPFPWPACPIHASLKEGIVHREERDVMWRKDGAPVSVAYTATPLLDEGHVAGAVVVLQDIGPRLEAEEGLLRKQLQLDEAQAIAHVGSWTYDPETGEGTLSSEARRILGYGLDDPAPGFGGFVQRIHPDDRAKAQEVHEGLQAGVSVEVEVRISHPEGSLRTVLFRGRRDPEAGRGGLYVGSVADVTREREDARRLRELNAALAHRAAELREAQRVAKLGSWSWTAQGNRTEWSDETYELLGLVPGSQPPSLELFLQRVHPEDRERVLADIQREGAKAGAFALEFRVLCPDGVERRMRARNESTLAPDGSIAHMMGTTQDITEQWAAEEHERALNAALEQRAAELREANQEMESFAYSVSHDLRSPLRSLDGFSQALAEDYGAKLDAQGQDYLRRIQGSARRMGDLIDALLVLSRVGRTQMQRGPVDLTAMARAVLAELAQASPGRAVDVRAAEGLAADADPTLVRALLQNLLGNAWKFTSKKDRATIEVGAVRSKGETAFFVRDDGAGFDPAFAEKLFKPFQRLHGQEEFEGTGVGLATVHRIVQRHGGRVWAEGAPDKGATFWFTLAPAKGDPP